jgi:hypothetical protein
MSNQPQACEVCGSSENVTYGPDPHNSVSFNGRDVWLCEKCHNERETWNLWLAVLRKQ